MITNMMPYRNNRLVDFNDGCRVWLPETDGPYRVRLSDIDSGNVLFETEIKFGRINSTKRCFVRIRLQIWIKDDIVLEHDDSAADRDVLIQLPEVTVNCRACCPSRRTCPSHLR